MSAKLAGSLFTQRRFWPLFVLLQTGTFNDNALKQALISLITFGGIVFLPGLPSDMRVPIAAFIFTIPFTFIAAIAGQIADKVDRGRVLRRMKRVEIAIMLLAATGFWFGNVWVLCVALFCMGAQSGFYSPTRNSVLPQWLNTDELITGNGLLSGFAFVFILVGQVGGGLLVLATGGPKLLAGILVVVAVLGWLASEFCPPAPPPKPELRVNYEPVTAMLSVLGRALSSPAVLRPMLGIAWFYGLSTVSVTALPDYVASVMGYDQNVLYLILVGSIVGILAGSLTCSFFDKLRIWGPEAVGLSALGITGVVLFSAVFVVLLPSQSAAMGGELAGVGEFLGNPRALQTLAALIAVSVCGGLFVIPLQAMAQRRADPAIRARLMSAGAVLLNLAVNAITLVLIGVAALALPAKAPFLLITIPSIPVAIYALYKWARPTNWVNPTLSADGTG